MMQGLLNFGLTYVCTYEAEGYLVSALVAVLFALMVFWNALGARLFFSTRLGNGQAPHNLLLQSIC